jgi:extradiol dioxygenase family protein
MTVSSEWSESKQLSEDDVKHVLRDNLHSDHMLEERVKSIMQFQFQQAFNCCQVTTVAYALSTLGFPTAPDDIFWSLEVDIDTAVHNGMTLSETHELALRYINKLGLPVFVEAYHFDEQANLTADDLWDACWEDGKNGNKDVIALNFHSGIAHGREQGGGHFSLLLGAIPDTRELIVSDVHPLKYGALWATPVAQMFAAMARRDRDIGRARGLLRFGRHGQGLQRPMPTLRRANRLVDWIAPPDPYIGAQLQRYIPRKWSSFMGASNMEGPSAVSLACNALGQNSPQVSNMDCIMRALRESYTGHLNKFSNAGELFSILRRLSKKRYIEAEPFLHSLGQDFDTATLRSALQETGAGTAPVAALVPFDIDVAYGGKLLDQTAGETNALSHGTKHWALVAGFDAQADDEDINGMIVAAAHGIAVHGRLWRCSIGQMARAMRSVGCEQLLLLRAEERRDQNAQMERVLSLLANRQDGELDAEGLWHGLNREGFKITHEQARTMVRAASHRGRETLDHSEAMEMLVDFLGFHPDHAHSEHPRKEALSAFLNAHGCEPNELGFATVHLAMCTADIHRNVKFYNNVIGWPLYKTIDRAHGHNDSESYGSSWASYGAFASFIVFHQEFEPVGRRGHGPWAAAGSAPAGLTDLASEQTRIPFHDIPMPFLGVILEADFFDLQMKRIAEKDPSLKWLDIEGVSTLFGGGEIASADVLRDPDGYPLIFFVSTHRNEAYAERFPATPFVYGSNITANYPSAEQEARKREMDAARIRSCPTIRKYRSNERTRRSVNDWLSNHVYGKDSLQQHRHYYEQVLNCDRLAEVHDPDTQVVQLEYEWDRHFLVLRTSLDYRGILSGGEDQHHDMGGNKGLVPVPHFGVNTSHSNFSALREKVSECMDQHGLPLDMCGALSAMGHAPPYNTLDSYHLLFPSDPDSCLSMLASDPSGNINEVKFYLDFGEMFHGSDSFGISDIVVDNSLVDQHFPPAVLRMMESRGKRGESDGIEVLRAEQKELEDQGVFHKHD